MNNWKRKTGDFNQDNRLYSSQFKEIASLLSVQSSFSIFNSKTYLSGLSMLTLGDLKLHYDKLLKELKHVNVENYLLEKYLERVKPNSLQELIGNLDAVEEVKKRVRKMSQKINPKTSMVDLDESISGGTITSSDKRRTIGSGFQSFSGARSTMKAQSSSFFLSKLTYAFRSDMATHELDEIQIRMQHFQKRCKILKFILKAEIEERVIAKNKLKATRETLKENFNKLAAATGRVIPAEKYLKHINDLLSRTEQETEKMKLKTASMRRMYSRLKVNLSHAMELGETIHAIDYDELRLENKDYAEDLENKNKYLVDLKRTTGFCTLNLNLQNRYLDELKATMDSCNNEIKSKEFLIDKRRNEIAKTFREITKARRNNDSIKNIITNYKAPSVLDYARTKSRLRTIQKDLKIWSRRVHLQDVTIKLLKNRLRKKINSVYHYCRKSSVPAPVIETKTKSPKNII